MIYRQIQINSTVKVIDNGETYVNFSEMFQLMGFKDKAKNKSFDYGTQATVFAIDQHPAEHHTLYALVDSEGRECLISERGIELVEHEAHVSRVTFESVLTRLTEIESKLDQYAQFIASQNKPQTAVEWLVSELLSYDWSDSESRLEICMTLDKFAEIKGIALGMEMKQNTNQLTEIISNLEEDGLYAIKGIKDKLDNVKNCK